ncbi:radical SAM protein [Streptomyces sparsogenes]|uniref:Coenzyme PQQ synthesis protein n=1 Tax=Streptomyces sparsogenes DSM 40356 TaxID=1331668 RepID=A0A1R1S5P6_9ACTN|nr:radical SAM protein [Streptomyces sparsogenes]OMI33553.1 coenzyme PQQ synthesis protein [Streptomyces sparsogenes DSM 40356]
MTARPIISDGRAASCYFRTTVDHPYRKALIQICEPCNERCGHCFVSATKRGEYMVLEAIRDQLIPQLAAARVNRVTLTGGEPFMHADLIQIVREFRAVDMGVGVCTNATMVTDHQITLLAQLGAHMNVSLDGFSAESHGKFRGRPEGFKETVETVKRFAAAGILQGLLCTPNNLAQDEEYAQLCAFAKDQGAKYVLMNPLGPMGRGANSQRRLRRPDDHMRHIRDLTMPFEGDDLDVVHIRFPNDDKPLAGCEANTIIYVFTKGEVAVCPYLVFAARTKASQHPDTDFIVGNVWADNDIAAQLDAYKFHERWTVGDNPTCGSCAMSPSCGKGCPAAVVAAGYRVGAVDSELCPVVPPQSRVLPLVGVS